MKLKPIAVTVITTTLLSSPIWIAHLAWRAAPLTSLRLLVVDYTVPTDRYRNHLGLMWLLSYLKVTDLSHAREWKKASDYVGFRPGVIGGETRLHEVALEAYDWVYVADTYGVWLEGPPLTASGKPGQRATLLFGGLSREDALELAHFAKQGKSLVLEFNAFHDPTPEDVRKAAEEIVGVRATGWAGCFLPDMSVPGAVPPWLPELYAARHLGLSLPPGPGMLLIHRDGRLLLLHGERFERTMPSLVLTEAGKARFPGVHGTPPYIGWFSIVRRRVDAVTLAEIQLPTPPHWKARLSRFGLPDAFPLLTEYRVGASLRYYLSANLSNMDEVPDHYQLAGLPWLEAAVHRRRDSFSYSPAYWQFFFPVMGEILKRAGAGRSPREAVP